MRKKLTTDKTLLRNSEFPYKFFWEKEFLQFINIQTIYLFIYFTACNSRT